MKARLEADQLPQLFEQLKKYCEPGKKYIFEICQERTLSQNEYYQAVVIPCFSSLTGYTRVTAHRILSKRFLSKLKDGKIHIRSTTELNSEEFELYLEECRLWVWHFWHRQIPLPNQMSEDKILELEKVYKY